MPSLTPEQLNTDSESLLREWQDAPTNDADAVVEQLARLRALAVYLNANFRSEIPTA
jgi:hypothetical protein